MYEPIQSARLYEQIAAQIEERIISGDLECGDKLPSELELADQFGANTLVENITAALDGFRCYERRDEAVKRVLN